MLFVVGAYVGALFMLTSCATTPDAKPASATWTAKDYSALAVGNAWTYRIAAQGQQQDQTITIDAQDDNGFFVDNMGGRLMQRKAGVFDGQRFLLEDPLEVGHKWIAVQGPSSVEHYEIAATGLVVEVPAGVYKDCVQVRAQQKGRTKTGEKTLLTMEWTYAPNVGLIEMKQKAKVGTQPEQVGMHLSLLKFAPSGS